jgi:RecA-family ATPase
MLSSVFTSIGGQQACIIIRWRQPKTGKSFVAVDMALSIAAGTSFHDHSVAQGAVVYVGAEGVNGLRRRVMAWCMEQGVEDPEALPMLWARRGEDFTDKDEVKALAAEIAAFAADAGMLIRLIVIDTLNRNFGGSDENNTQDMTKFVSNLDYLRAEYDAAVLVVHHSGLSDKNRSRGNSALFGAIDARMMVSKMGDNIKFEVLELKDAENPPPMLFSKHKVEFCIPGYGEANSLVVRKSGMPIKAVREAEFIYE